MAVDPSAQGVLDLFEALEIPAFERMTPEECRNVFEELRDPDAVVAAVAKVEEREIAGVPVRVYTPEGTGPRPVLQWMHGGGWVIGSAERADPTVRELCSRSGCVVVSLDYRLAPESQFPAAVEDAFAVADWLAVNAAELGGDPALLAVGGDSAGGNLAAVISQMRPGVFGFQVLIYPSVDMTFSFPSIDTYAEGFLLTKAWMLWFRDHYLGGLDVDLKDPQISPLYASDPVLSTCPPAFVLTTGYDPLQDEGLAYADKLEANGVAVQHVHFGDQIHGFYGMPQAIPAALQALDATAQALRDELAS